MSWFFLLCFLLGQRIFRALDTQSTASAHNLRNTLEQFFNFFAGSTELKFLNVQWAKWPPTILKCDKGRVEMQVKDISPSTLQYVSTYQLPSGQIMYTVCHWSMWSSTSSYFRLAQISTFFHAIHLLVPQFLSACKAIYGGNAVHFTV